MSDKNSVNGIINKNNMIVSLNLRQIELNVQKLYLKKLLLTFFPVFATRRRRDIKMLLRLPGPVRKSLIQ